MPTQPDSIDIEQLRAQLDAIYAPSEESIEVSETPPQQAIEVSPYGPFDVKRLTREAKSYSPNHEAVAKVERIETFGKYLESLRQRSLGD